MIMVDPSGNFFYNHLQLILNLTLPVTCTTQKPSSIHIPRIRFHIPTQTSWLVAFDTCLNLLVGKDTSGYICKAKVLGYISRCNTDLPYLHWCVQDGR